MVPEQYSFSVNFNEPYQNFSQLRPVLSKNLEFQLVGLINRQRIVLCYRQAQVTEEPEHVIVDFFINFTKQQLRFLNYLLQYSQVATLRPQTACVLQNDFVFDDYID